MDNCKKQDKNPLSITIRYVSGGRRGGSSREVLECTVNEVLDIVWA